MKRIALMALVGASVVLPALPASADTATPAEYRPECDQGYNALKPVWDAILGPAKAVFGPLETGICGEQKYTPK